MDKAQQKAELSAIIVRTKERAVHRSLLNQAERDRAFMVELVEEMRTVLSVTVDKLLEQEQALRAAERDVDRLLRQATKQEDELKRLRHEAHLRLWETNPDRMGG